jgi:hypothetical protein
MDAQQVFLNLMLKQQIKNHFLKFEASWLGFKQGTAYARSWHLGTVVLCTAILSRASRHACQADCTMREGRPFVKSSWMTCAGSQLSSLHVPQPQQPKNLP